MKKYNVIVIFDKTEKKLLMCKRAKDPFKENIILSEEKLNKMKQRMKLLIVNYMKKQVFQKKILILLVY